MFGRYFKRDKDGNRVFQYPGVDYEMIPPPPPSKAHQPTRSNEVVTQVKHDLPKKATEEEKREEIREALEELISLCKTYKYALLANVVYSSKVIDEKNEIYELEDEPVALLSDKYPYSPSLDRCIHIIMQKGDIPNLYRDIPIFRD